jgi:hypothetical protein
MTNSLPWYRWPIEIDDLPMKNGDFPWQTVSHNEMVTMKNMGDPSFVFPLEKHGGFFNHNDLSMETKLHTGGFEY